MTLTAAGRDAIERAMGRRIVRATALRGGCVAEVWRITLDDGAELVAKLGRGLALEAYMLDWLRRNGAVPVPAIRLARDDLLLMEFIAHDEGGIGAEAERDLAAVVARLHGVPGEHFGFEQDTVIGGLPQPNAASTDWRQFFADYRLRFMADQARTAGQLPGRVASRVETLCAKLDRWIDAGAAPALIHGDLWHGNILARGGRIVGLLDPAIYFADPEIELAFMTLFGSVGETFFASYREIHPIASGFFEARRHLYNLYPLLVHVRLFGGGYVGQVERILDRFGA
ncbi:MAG TPA: fructosamine kinase family protein [Alphaproteobacteria bacterium]|nr:fructosamine kinase family protein [Alphaproteobacteria bacterium]